MAAIALMNADGTQIVRPSLVTSVSLLICGVSSALSLTLSEVVLPLIKDLA